MLRTQPRRAATAACLILSAWALAVPDIVGAEPDHDGDGSLAPADCRPLDPAVHPGAVDRPDLTFEDMNCDGFDGDAGRSVFVAKSGNDGATGTRLNPLATISHAMAVAAAATPPKDVIVAGGTYIESITLRNGVSVYGGYAPVQWTRSATETVTIQGAPQAAYASGARGVVLQLLDLEGTRGGDANAYGLRAVNGSSIALARVGVKAGPAGPGAGAAWPSKPPKAGTGFNGGNGASCREDDQNQCGAYPGGGGFGGSGANRGGSGGIGGYKWDAADDGSPGSTGTGNDSGWGLGGAGGGTRDRRGQPAPNYGALGGPTIGKPGTSGPNGANATGFRADLAGTSWVGAAGTPGTPGGAGGAGGGGGGGGGSYADCTLCSDYHEGGGGGGGGGAGGWGGPAGGGGAAGGGSFAVYLHASNLVVLDAATLRAGDGGTGGDGAPGAAGGDGGNGGNGGAEPPDGITAGNGGSGAPGGAGGNGGSGGGGAGGPSYGIFRTAATSTIVVKPGSQITVGGAGLGGRFAGTGGRAASGEALAIGPAGTQESPTSDFDGDAVADREDGCATLAGPAGNRGCPVRATIAAPACTNADASTPAGGGSVAVALPCTGPAGIPLTYAIVSGPAHGTLSAPDATGRITYTSNAGYHGQDTFTYRATNAGGNSQPATATIAVLPTPPRCADIAGTASSGGVAMSLSCSSPEGAAVRFEIVSAPAHGTISAVDQATGKVSYIPAAGYHGTDAFTYAASNAGGRSNPVTATITVPPASPACSNLRVNTPTQQGTVTIRLPCTGPSGVPISYTIVGPPANGTLRPDGNGAMVYTPRRGYVGMDRFTYRAGNAGGNSSVATVTIQIPITAPSVTWKWDARKAYTIAKRLIVNNVPAAAKVRVSCKGRKCPFKTRTARRRGDTADVGRLLGGRKLAPGTRVTVAIVKPDAIGKVYVFTIRAGRDPRHAPPQCLAPGSTVPGRGC